MIVPIIPSSEHQPTDTDHRDLLTAIKLLSGQDCLRDASQAQKMLVGLTESRHADVSADARAIMQSGLKNGWFENRTPKFFDLQLLAEKSLANYNKPSAAIPRQLFLLISGLVALLVGGILAFMASQGSLSSPASGMILTAVLVFALLVGLVWFKIQIKK